jgi:hypothetical protein
MRALATQTYLEALTKQRKANMSTNRDHKQTNVVAAEAFGIFRRNDPTYNQLRWIVTCGCGKVSTIGEQQDVNPNALVTRMRNRDWSMSQKHAPICPDCLKEKRVNTKTTVGPDPKIARKVYALLDDHFDETKRLYRAGWNDKKVAEAADTSLDLVVDTRRRAYGELAEDPILQVVRDDLELLRMEVAELTKRYNTDVATVLERIAEIERKIPNRGALAA